MNTALFSKKKVSHALIYQNPLNFATKNDFYYAHSQAILQSKEESSAQKLQELFNTKHSSTAATSARDGLSVKMTKKEAVTLFAGKEENNTKSLVRLYGRSYVIPRLTASQIEANFQKLVAKSDFETTEQNLDNLIELTNKGLSGFVNTSVQMVKRNLKNKMATNKQARIKNYKPKLKKEVDLVAKIVARIKENNAKFNKFEQVGKLKVLKVPKENKKKNPKWTIKNYEMMKEIVDTKTINLRQYCLSERLSGVKNNTCLTNLIEQVECGNRVIVKKLKKMKNRLGKKSKLVDKNIAFI